MTTKYLKTFAMLMAVLTLATACKDDDDNSQTPDETEVPGRTAEQQADLTALATVLNTLTGQALSDTTDIDFEGKTFEPTYGEVLTDDKPFERAIKVRSAAAAEGYFRLLVGSSANRITETADGCTIDLTNLDSHSTGKKQTLGTLTFHRPQTGDSNMGWAEVSIRCIPRLQTIVYKTEAQWGKNARFKSPCQYGEVFVNSGKYYVCVRECGGYGDGNEGALVCMEGGKGTNTRYIDDMEDEHKGVWRPEHDGPWWAITDYLLLCADEDYLSDKRRIVKNMPGKVFPYMERYNCDGDHNVTHFTVEDATLGFGSTKAGYTHWANGQYQEDKNNRVWIVRDSWEGEWEGAYFGYQRRTDVFVLPIDCEHSRDARQETMTLYRRSGRFLGLGFYHNGIYDDWQSWQGGKIIYTASIVLFKETKPEGFSLVDI